MQAVALRLLGYAMARANSGRRVADSAARRAKIDAVSAARGDVAIVERYSALVSVRAIAAVRAAGVGRRIAFAGAAFADHGLPAIVHARSAVACARASRRDRVRRAAGGAVANLAGAA